MRLLPVTNCHVPPLSEPIRESNKHTRALRNNGSVASWCGVSITGQEEVRRDRFFESPPTPKTLESGMRLLPVTNCHVPPLSEPIHESNKHTRALRNNGNVASWCGVSITGQEEVRRDRFFESPPTPKTLESGMRLLSVT